MLEFVQNKPKVRAKVVDCGGRKLLVAHLATSKSPVTWQIDMEKISGLSLVVNSDDTGYHLGTKSGAGEFTPIATFFSREDTEGALKKITDALLGQRGPLPQIRMRWVILAVVVVLLLAVAKAPSNTPSISNEELSKIEAGNLVEDKSAPKTGVPQTADDILKPPPE
jgi:hypothetical protein